MKKAAVLLLFILFCINCRAQLSQNGLLFDGVDDRVIVPNNAVYNIGTGNLTLEAWIRADAPAASSIWEYIVTQYQGGISTGIGLALAYNGNLSFSINGSGYGPGSTTNLRDGLCHHVAVVRKDSLITFFVDGAPQSGSSTMATTINSAAPLCIGAYNSVPPSNQAAFKGLIKELRYWNVARTNAQLLSNMSSVPPSNSVGLIGYWRMNAASGQVVTDGSLLANNGTLGYNTSVEGYDPGFSTGCPSCAQTTAVITAGGSLSFCIGDSVLLTPTVGVNYTYQWYKNGVAIPGAVAGYYYAKLSGAYSVKLTNASGCSSFSNALDVIQLLDNAGGISCSGYTVGAWACLNGGNARTLSIGTGPGYSYQWKRNNVNIIGAISNTYTTTVAGSYTCTVTSGSCVRTSATFDLGPNPVTVSTTGTSTTVCTGPVNLISSRTYGSQNAIYDWKLNGVSVGAPNYWTYATNQSGSFTCTVTDAVCPGSVTSNAIGVTVGVLPPVYISPVGGSQTISECVSSQIFLDAVNSNGTFYNWDPGITSFDWYKDGFPYASFSSSITVTESGIYSLYINSTCGTVSSQNPKIVLLTTSTPPQISYPYLSNCTQVPLSVSNYWFAFQWHLNGNPIPGAITPNYNATQTGTYTCQMYNACGSILSSPVYINITGSLPVINAPSGTVICGTASKLLQAPTGIGYSYQWKLNNNNILNATLSTYFTNVAGSYTCQVTNSCGPGLSNAIVLSSGPAVPVAPGTITGTAKPCPGTNNVSYSIVAVVGAASYLWSVPAGFTIVSGQGTTNLVVNVPVGFVSGNVLVSASNTCGTSAASSKALASKIPSVPGAISGTTNGVCSSTGSYSISAVSQATGYTWSVPTGASIVSGQGTTSVSVAFNNSYGADSIRVFAFNSCGAGPSKGLYVKGRPAIPGAISGTVNVCAGQTGLVYSISPVSGASSYTWTKPSGATFTNGQGTTQVTMTMGSASGAIKVKAVNTCGASSNKSLALNVVCRESEMEEGVSLTTAPNPFNQSLTVQLSTLSSRSSDGRIWNALGQIVETFRLAGNEGVAVGHLLPPGVYIVEVDLEGQLIRKKVIKKK